MTLWVDHKFAKLAGAKLERFKQTTPKLYNFRCPFCGDSQRDKTKARGYLYEVKDRMLYKCHNCGESKNLRGLLNKVDPVLERAYVLEAYTENKDKKKPQPEIKPPDPKTFSGKDLERVGCIPVTDNSRAVQYLKDRKIPEEKWDTLWYCPNMSALVQLNRDYDGRLIPEERILIPFTDKYGNITGVCGRAIGNSNKRYINVRLKDVPLVYGLPGINTHKTVYVTEGAFDSMFLENAVAAGGSDFTRAADMFEGPVLVFDNEPRNAEIVKLMEKMIAKDYKMVIWPKAWGYKDINDAVKFGIDISEVREVVLKNTFGGLTLKLAMRDWKKHE